MMKGERLVAKRSSFGTIVRRRLSDISNLHSQPRLLNQEEKASQCSPSNMDYIEHLLEENKALMELVAERNKIIESNTAELQKLRTNCQKLQQQNLLLTQSNSHFLAELNLGREKLTVLQHELVCKNALLKAMNLEAKRKAGMNRDKSCSKEEEDAKGEPLPQTNVGEKHCNRNRRRNTRSQSLGPPTTNQQQEKERAENKRRCLRRQSHSLKPQREEVSENLFEIEDAKFLISKPSDNPTHGGPSSLGSSIKKEDKEGDHVLRTEASQRSSIGRPLRRATEKVQSYKEVPLNVKMRRPEWA